MKNIGFQCPSCVGTNMKRMSSKRLLGTEEGGTFHMDTLEMTRSYEMR
jgi:hypothetical protein